VPCYDLARPQTAGGRCPQILKEPAQANDETMVTVARLGGRFSLSGWTERTVDMARPEKEQAVEELARRFSESDAVLLTEYRGLGVGDMADLRSALREVDADYKVFKNTLARIAVKEVGLEDLAEQLEGPTAIAFCRGDAAAAAKALDEATKRFPVLVVKGGVLDGKIISDEDARALARLEPREVQLAKIAMLVNGSVQQAANVFSALLRDLGSMLAQVVASKRSDGAADESETQAQPQGEQEAPSNGESEAAESGEGQGEE
jgi:large subunit ribosomal protein L10